MSSGITIPISGLTADAAERLAERWCAVAEGGDGGTASASIDVSLGPSAAAVTARNVHVERFGSWTATLHPGGGSNWVSPDRDADSASEGFLKAFDLCVTHALALSGAVVVHAASFETGGVAVLAVGGSGSGKSTLTAAALRVGARVVSDDLLLVARRGSGGVRVETLRRELYFREPGVSALPQALSEGLQAFDDAGEPRWRLTPGAAPSAWVGSLLPARLWLVSVDRRLGASRCAVVDQAAALAWLIRGISSLFLTVPFHTERGAILDVLGALVSTCTASRVRLGRDLIAEPATAVDRLLLRDGGA